jgi:hypothetical protein
MGVRVTCDEFGYQSPILWTCKERRAHKIREKKIHDKIENTKNSWGLWSLAIFAITCMNGLEVGMTHPIPI